MPTRFLCRSWAEKSCICCQLEVLSSAYSRLSEAVPFVAGEESRNVGFVAGSAEWSVGAVRYGVRCVVARPGVHRLWRGEAAAVVASLSRWLEHEGVGTAAVDELTVGRFVDDRRASGHTKMLSVRAAGPLMAYLRGIAVVAPACPPRCDGPVEELLARYVGYLIGERGLLADSARGYAVNVRPFLEGLVGPDGVELDRIDGPAVVAFVVSVCPSQSRSSAKRTTKALRSLLRFLHLEGLVMWPLDHAVPAASGWRLVGLPRRLESGQVGQLLAACDRSTAVGRRDFAILIALARLGLRVGEIARLSLDDIDWRAGELVVHGKHSRVDRLPLPVDVGEAIVEYLRTDRPSDALDRSVFIRVGAPHRSVSGSGVTMIVRQRALAAGLSEVCAHQLRHTLASEMLRAGGTLPEIGQVLRHQHAPTTAIYAKVDRGALRQIARPRPGAVA
jgi:integrase/recombinase XerD